MISVTLGSAMVIQPPITVPPSLNLFLSASARPSMPSGAMPIPGSSPDDSATQFLLMLDLVRVELHVDAYGMGQPDHSVHRPERILQEEHVHQVPLPQIFLVRRVDRRLGHREVDADRRRVPVRD